MNIMRRIMSAACVVFAALFTAGASAEDLSEYKTIDATVRDLALIWQGGEHRIKWTQKEFEPYVTHKFADGREEWIFDGYLFLDACTNYIDGRWFDNIPNTERSTKADYIWYLDRLFKEDRALDALDKAIGEKKKILGDPGFKHKVALTCFEPIQGQKDWGELNGRALDFSKPQDRFDAEAWLIDEYVTRFNAAGYENIELYGIYMLTEDINGIESFTRKIAPHIKKYGLDFLWIPYFRAKGVETWAAQKFTTVYMQPNHYTQPSIPDSRLDEAVSIARRLKIGLEFEFDDLSLSQRSPNLRSRMIAYMDKFEKLGVWYDMPVAHYSGYNAFLDMYRHPSDENAEVMDRLCQYIVNRKEKALEGGAVIEVSAGNVAPVYYNLQGFRVENPEGGIFIEKRGDIVRKVLK